MNQSTSAVIPREGGSSQGATNQESTSTTRQSLPTTTGSGIAPVRAHLQISCHIPYDSAIEVQREPELDLVIVHLFQKKAGDTENSHRAFFEYTSEGTRRPSSSRRNSIYTLPKSNSRRGTFELDATSRHSEPLDDAQPAVIRPAKTLWLQDGLLRTLPLSRVICMGFYLDSTPRLGNKDLVDFEAASHGLLEELNKQRSGSPNRPFIFLGHSYGCYVFTERSSDSPKIKPTEACGGFVLESFLSACQKTNLILL